MAWSLAPSRRAQQLRHRLRLLGVPLQPAAARLRQLSWHGAKLRLPRPRLRALGRARSRREVPEPALAARQRSPRPSRSPHHCRRARRLGRQAPGRHARRAGCGRCRGTRAVRARARRCASSSCGSANGRRHADVHLSAQPQRSRECRRGLRPRRRRVLRAAAPRAQREQPQHRRERDGDREDRCARRRACVRPDRGARLLASRERRPQGLRDAAHRQQASPGRASR